jgi:glycosyltransferase involved in cell wall biosynthesis
VEYLYPALVAGTVHTAMLFQGAEPHPAHRAFGDAVDADYRHFETGRPPNGEDQDVDAELARLRTGISISTEYDLMIAEGSAPLQTLLVYGVRSPETTCVFLAADETFYDLDARRSRHLWRVLRPLVDHLLDGVVAISEDVLASVRPVVGSTPTRKVYPPIADDKHESLSALDPASSTGDGVGLLTAGTVKPVNNHDLLRAAAERLREEHNTAATVTILGAGHDTMPYAEPEWVRTPGFVDVETFRVAFRDATVYVQPSRRDGFSVAAAEGMLSGTPTVVTEGVGARELLEDEFVAELTPSSLADTLVGVVETDTHRRKAIGRRQRKTVVGLTETRQASEFQAAADAFHTN